MLPWTPSFWPSLISEFTAFPLSHILLPSCSLLPGHWLLPVSLLGVPWGTVHVPVCCVQVWCSRPSRDLGFCVLSVPSFLLPTLGFCSPHVLLCFPGFPSFLSLSDPCLFLSTESSFASPVVLVLMKFLLTQFPVWLLLLALGSNWPPVSFLHLFRTEHIGDDNGTDAISAKEGIKKRTMSLKGLAGRLWKEGGPPLAPSLSIPCPWMELQRIWKHMMSIWNCSFHKIIYQKAEK